MSERLGRTVLRVVAHLVAEVPLFVVAGLQIAHGWLPTSDDAVIAWRTWDVLSGPTPLVGQFTQISAANGHAAFDLGPLQYFLLAVPERIDPAHGLLWGAALLAAALVALAIEAGWSAGGPRVGPVCGLAVAAGAAVMTATLSESTVNLAWNPSVGVYALGATMAAGIAAGAGRLIWLPGAVVAGSLAAQCHVSFAAPALACLLVGTVLGIVNRQDRSLAAPLGAAAAAGVACWIAPLVQQLTGHPGNWSVLANSLGRHGAPMGTSFGLRALASAAQLPPSWSSRPPALGTVALLRTFQHRIYGGSSAWGAGAIFLCAAIAVGAMVARRRGLASLAAVAALSGLAVAWTVGSVPVAQHDYLFYYLYFPLWPAGMAILATFAATLLSAGSALASRLARAARPPRYVGPALLGSALALAVGGGVLVSADVGYGTSGLFLLGWQPVRLVAEATPAALALARKHHAGEATRASERAVDVIATHEYPFVASAVSEGVGYLLVTHGVPARLTGDAERPLGPGLTAPAGAPTIAVRISFPHHRPATSVSWIPPVRR